MKARSTFGSKKILLFLTLLIGALSASAIAFGDTILTPYGFVSEASSIAKLESEVQVVGNPTRLRPGTLPGLASPSMFDYQITVDDSGPDDEPGQKDLNLMAVDFGFPGDLAFKVKWNWDNTATSGNNTRDGGALFDTDGDGNANYSLYITVKTDGSWVTQLYVCTADSRTDRCGGPSLNNSFSSSSSVAVEANTDPFRSTATYPTHSTGNTCSNRPGCYTADTVANVNAVLTDFGNPANIKLLNVCSYPSGEPNSDPSDCVVENAPGYLTLVKVVDNLGKSGYKTPADFPLKIDGNNTTNGTSVPVVAGNHTISETSDANYTVGTWTCNGAATGTPGSATATVSVASGQSVTCTITNTLIFPAISLDKTAVTAFSTPPKAGDKITYTFQITNTGNATLTGVDLDDSLLGYSNVTCGTTTLAPGASTSCNADYFLTQANVNAGSVSNIATACGDSPAGVTPAEVCHSDGTTTNLTQAKTIDLKKTATTTFSSPPKAGDKIRYDFEITNTGNVTLTGVDLDDALLAFSNATCGATTLAPGAKANCSADYFLTQADVDAGTRSNSATACGDPPVGTEVCDTDGTTTPITRDPKLSITKTASPTTYSAVNQVITYTIVAKNEGNVTLNNVAVTDASVANLDCDANAAGNQTTGFTLAPQQTLTCSASHTITQADLDNGSFQNTACVDDGAGPAAQKCDEETVTGVPDPKLSIVKDDNGATFDSVGDVITYSITATNTGNVTLSSVTITDALATLGACNPVANGSSLAPGASITCSATYTVTQGDIDRGSYLNTACVDDGAGPAAQVCDDEETPSVQTRALLLVKTARIKVITYSFVITNTGNTTLSLVGLTDPLFISETNPTGQVNDCTAASLAPGAQAVCEADYTVTDEDYQNGYVTNVATATANNGGIIRMATVTVTPLIVVSPTPTPTP